MKKKPIKINKWDIVLIKWNDAASHGGWRDNERYESIPYGCNTIGFFLGANEYGMHVVQNDGWAAGMMSEIMQVPHGMITHVEVIRRAKTA